MTGYVSKRAAARDKLDDDDTLTIAYQSGYYDGKKAAQPAQEPVAWMYPDALCDRNCLYVCTKAFTQFPECATTPPQPAQDKLAQDAFDEWWDSNLENLSPRNPCMTDSFEYWAWEGWHAALALTSTKCEVQPAQEPIQVSPLEFVEMVMDKEHLVGNPIVWAQWPNKERNGG